MIEIPFLYSLHVRRVLGSSQCCDGQKKQLSQLPLSMRKIKLLKENPFYNYLIYYPVF